MSQRQSAGAAQGPRQALRLVRVQALALAGLVARLGPCHPAFQALPGPQQAAAPEPVWLLALRRRHLDLTARRSGQSGMSSGSGLAAHLPGCCGTDARDR